MILVHILNDCNDTVNIDQGVVFGGMLTAWRMPEREAVSVPAKQDYAGDPDSPLKRWEQRRFAPPNIRKFKEGFTVQTASKLDVSVHGEVAKTAIDTFSHYTVPLEETDLHPAYNESSAGYMFCRGISGASTGCVPILSLTGRYPYGCREETHGQPGHFASFPR